MSWLNDRMGTACSLTTYIQSGRQDELRKKRERMVREAIRWPKGTLEQPMRYDIASLGNGTKLYFLKPGKETANVSRPNPHDMTPVLGNGQETLRFDQIWAQLSKASLIDLEAFKALLTLVYRNAYLMDHKDIDGNIRYSPEGQVLECISSLEEKIGRAFPYGVEGFLRFLDLLGWNEDVKYHTENDEPTFKGRYGSDVGRVNTLLTCIRVPYQTFQLVNDVLDHGNDRENIDFGKVYEVMQQFAKSRGTATPTKAQLLGWLSPYLVAR